MFAFSRRAALVLPLLVVSAAWAAEDADNTVILTTAHGKVVIHLRPDWAPKHVAQIKTLVKSKFYDGIVFHRVIPGFMAQTGDPTGTGTGGSTCPTCPPNSTRRISPEARSAWRVRKIRIPPIRSSSSAFADARIPRWKIYRVRRSRFGHGRRRQDQGRNRGQQRHGHEPGQDRDHAHGRRREMTRSDEMTAAGRHADPRDEQRARW